MAEARAETILAALTKGEYQSWKTHPCTKALESTIEAELDRLVLDVVNGVFSSKTLEESALKQAHAIGSSLTLTLIQNYIDNMLENTQIDEDVYEEALHKP